MSGFVSSEDLCCEGTPSDKSPHACEFPSSSGSIHAETPLLLLSIVQVRKRLQDTCFYESLQVEIQQRQRLFFVLVSLENFSLSLKRHVSRVRSLCAVRVQFFELHAHWLQMWSDLEAEQPLQTIFWQSLAPHSSSMLCPRACEPRHKRRAFRVPRWRAFGACTWHSYSTSSPFHVSSPWIISGNQATNSTREQWNRVHFESSEREQEQNWGNFQYGKICAPMLFGSIQHTTKPTYKISDTFRLLISTENLAGFKFTLGIYELLAVMNFWFTSSLRSHSDQIFN